MKTSSRFLGFFCYFWVHALNFIFLIIMTSTKSCLICYLHFIIYYRVHNAFGTLWWVYCPTNFVADGSERDKKDAWVVP